MTVFKTLDIRGMSFFNAYSKASKALEGVKPNGILEIILEFQVFQKTTNGLYSLNMKMDVWGSVIFLKSKSMVRVRSNSQKAQNIIIFHLFRQMAQKFHSYQLEMVEITKFL